MRRVFASILAILILVLSLVPCSDVEAMVCMSGNNSETVLKSACGDKCPIHTADLCSPFCTCSCCAGCTVPESLAVDAPAIVPSHSKPVAAFIKERIERIALPIWQPPQLG
jgi:hypothetical protein